MVNNVCRQELIKCQFILKREFFSHPCKDSMFDVSDAADLGTCLSTDLCVKSQKRVTMNAIWPAHSLSPPDCSRYYRLAQHCTHI